jgi:hypothetical protein
VALLSRVRIADLPFPKWFSPLGGHTRWHAPSAINRDSLLCLAIIGRKYHIRSPPGRADRHCTENPCPSNEMRTHMTNRGSIIAQLDQPQSNKNFSLRRYAGQLCWFALWIVAIAGDPGCRPGFILRLAEKRGEVIAWSRNSPTRTRRNPGRPCVSTSPTSPPAASGLEHICWQAENSNACPDA